MVKLLHIKGINCWSNQFFNLLLELLQDVFSMCEKKPISNYKTKKIIKDLSLHYEKIDACKNDCVIYYKKKHTQASKCSVYGVSRWKPKEKGVK